MKKNIDPIDEAIGAELKSMRMKMGYTLQDVADRVGCTRQNVYYYEIGKCSISVSQLIKIAELYNSSYIVVLERVKHLLDK